MVDVVVFIPIAFMGGIVGQFFKPFGITVASATLFSLAVGFALTPMMASRFYRRETKKQHSQHADTPWNRWWDERFERFDNAFARMDAGYRRLLDWSLDNRFLTWVIGTVTLTTILITLMPAITTPFGLRARLFNLIVFVGILGGLGCVFSRDRKVAILFVICAALLTVLVHLRVKGELAPVQDRGQVAITVEAPAGSSLKYTENIIDRMERLIGKTPEVEYYLSVIGSASAGAFAGGDTGPQYARVTVQLVDRGRKERWEDSKEGARKGRHMVLRKRHIDDIVTEWREEAARSIAGAKIKIYNAESEGFGGAPIEMEVQGSNMEELNRVGGHVLEDWAARVAGRRGSPEGNGPGSEHSSGGPGPSRFDRG